MSERIRKQRIIVVGGGFAGVWAALGAVRKAQNTENDQSDLEVILVNPDPWLTIRPRLYEESFRDARVWLDRILEPVGIERIEGRVTDIEPFGQSVEIVKSEGIRHSISFDVLILAAGSQVTRPPISGLEEHAFTVDTYQEAVEINNQFTQLIETKPSVNVAVLGAGFTGLEVATEMVGRLRRRLDTSDVKASRVVLVDRSSVVGESLGDQPRPVIENALSSLDIDTELGSAVKEVTEDTIVLEDGQEILADLAIWTGGLRANPLASSIADSLSENVDDLDRLPVDERLRVDERWPVWAAGDVANAAVDDAHSSLQSCQHAQQMGRVAGHNAAAALLGEEGISYTQEKYVTCLDLGPWGALFAEGWDRIPKVTGSDAKTIKRWINWDLIVPPTSGQPDDILEAADPEFSPIS